MQHSPDRTVVVTVVPPSNGHCENYSSKTALVLAVVQLILGGTCFVCNITTLIIGDLYTIPSAGIWGGVLMLIAGGLGIGAAKRKSTCLIVAVMVMSILACLSTVIITAFSSMSLAIYLRWGYVFGLRVAMNIILVLCGVAELVVGIWLSALCCAVTCCGSGAQASRQGIVYQGPASQICQNTSTGGLLTMPSTAIGNVQYVTPGGQVVVLQQPAAVGNAPLPNYAQATQQQQAIPNYTQGAVYNQTVPGYTLGTVQPQPEVAQVQPINFGKAPAELS